MCDWKIMVRLRWRVSEKGGMRYTLPSLKICFHQKKESTYKTKIRQRKETRQWGRTNLDSSARGGKKRGGGSHYCWSSVHSKFPSRDAHQGLVFIYKSLMLFCCISSRFMRELKQRLTAYKTFWEWFFETLTKNMKQIGEILKCLWNIVWKTS